MMVISGRMAQENAIELLKIMNPPSVTYYEDIDDFIPLHSIAGEDNAEEEAKKYSVWAIISGDSFCIVKCSARKEKRKMNIIYNNKLISIRQLCQEENINYNTIKSAAGKKKKEMIDILIEKGYNIIKKGLHYEWKERDIQ